MISAILTFIFAFLCLIVLMIIHEFGHFIIAKKFGVRVDEFGVGYPPRLFGKKIGETIYSVNLLPLGAFVRIYGEEGGVDDYRSFTGLKIWQRVLIIIGGVAAFWIAAIIIFSVVFLIGADLPLQDQDVEGFTNIRVQVVQVSSESPAKEAGLERGDIITNIKLENSSVKIDKIKDFQDFTKENAGKELVLTVKRQQNMFDVSLTPRVSPPDGQGVVGVALERMGSLIEKYPWYQAPLKGAVYTWDVTVNALKGFYLILADLVSGRGAPEGASFAGPLGITVFLANAATYGPGFFLYFVGLISVFIAIFNLFPIPALDGGKLIFLAIEKIKGRPVSVKVEQTITLTFFILLIVLSLFVTIKFDIPRFTDFFKSGL